MNDNQLATQIRRLKRQIYIMPPDTDEYHELFNQLVELEKHHRELDERTHHER